MPCDGETEGKVTSVIKDLELEVCETPICIFDILDFSPVTDMLGDDIKQCSCTDITYCGICSLKVGVSFGDIGDHVDFDVHPWVCECGVCLEWRWTN